jgi:hypothetical protein
MRKSLLAILIAADERKERFGVHPLSHEKEIDAPGANLRVKIEVHVEWRVPPLAKAESEKRWILEFRTSA